MNIFNIIARNYIHKYIHLKALKKTNKLKRKARGVLRYSFSATLISTRATRNSMAGHALDNPRFIETNRSVSMFRGFREM